MSSTDPYSEHSETIEAVLAFICRRHRLAPDDGDEFSSWARLRLIDDECAVLRKFRGASSLRTYLVSVVLHLFQDWRNAQWGRWRPSVLARQLGPVAIELEKLVSRDGRDYEEAVETLEAASTPEGAHYVPRALEAVERALELSPGMEEALYNRALCLDKLGLVGEAEIAWRAFLDQVRDSGWAGDVRERLRSRGSLTISQRRTTGV